MYARDEAIRERDAASDRIAKLEGEVEAATAREIAAHDTLAMFRRSEGRTDLVPVSRHDLYTLHSMCSDAERERDAARAEVVALKASVDVEIAAMGDRVLRLESERDELATLCAAALYAKGQAERERAEATAELRYIRAELDDFDRSLRATVENMDKARAERDDARAQLLAIEKALINVGGELLARRAELDEARAEVESLRGELARLRAWATGERGEPSL